MMLPLLLLLFAASGRVELVNQTFEIPAAEWRYVELNLQQPATVICRFETQPDRRVRVALLRREDLERLRDERAHGIAAVTPPGGAGSLSHAVQFPGEYAVVVDNRTEPKRAARVRLEVSIDFARAAQPRVRTLSPTRQAAVVAISFAVFFGIVLYVGRMLLQRVEH